MERVKKGLERLGEDLYSLRYALLGIAVYYAAVHLLFGQFCPMMIVLHLPCPGCGMTRAFVLVLTGRLREAWELHPLVYGWILLGGMFGVNRYLLDKRPRMLTVGLVGLLFGMMVFYVYRMRNGFPVELMWG